jgi:hypothetical protein
MADVILVYVGGGLPSSDEITPVLLTSGLQVYVSGAKRGKKQES